MEMEDKKRVPSCRRLSVHLPVPLIFLSLCLCSAVWLIEARASPRSAGGSVQVVCVCLRTPSLSPSRLSHSPSQIQITAAHARNGPARFRFTCWTSVNKMSTVSSPPAFNVRSSAGAGERPKGRRLTTGRRGAIDRPIEPRTEASDPLAQVKTTLMSHTHTKAMKRFSDVLLGSSQGHLFSWRFYMNVFQASLLILSHFRSFSTQRNNFKKAVSKCSNRKIFSIGYETPALIFSRPGWTLSWALWEFKASSHHLNKKKLFDSYHRLNPSTFLGGFFFFCLVPTQAAERLSRSSHEALKLWRRHIYSSALLWRNTAWWIFRP